MVFSIQFTSKTKNSTYFIILTKLLHASLWELKDQFILRFASFVRAAGTKTYSDYFIDYMKNKMLCNENALGDLVGFVWSSVFYQILWL